MRTIVRLVACVALAIGSASCKTLEGGPDRLYGIQEEVTSARDVLDRAERAYYSSSDERSRLFFRNEYIARRMYVIDVEYSDYEAALTSERQKFGFATSTASNALSVIGGLTTPLRSAQLVSGIGGIIGASRGFYDSEIVIAKTIQIAEGHMRAQRDQIARTISVQRTRSTLDYPLSAALHDLEEYYRAGTLNSGLIEAAGVAGQEAQIASLNKASDEGVPPPLIGPRLLITDPGTRFQIPGESPQSGAPNRINAYERQLTVVTTDLIRNIQKTLCVPVDGDLGRPGSLTRKAIGDFLEGKGEPRAEELSRRRHALLLAAISEFESFPNCAAAKITSARQVGEHMKNQ